MALIVDNLLLDLLIIVTTSLAAIYAYFQYAYTYWQRRGVPFLQPKFPLGNSFRVLAQGTAYGAEFSRYYVDIKKQGYKFGGIYLVTHPVFIPVDPDYIKDILAKDFQYFIDRGQYQNEKNDPISATLFSLDDSRWKNLRMKLTPTFTSGKMKMMFQSVVDISHYMTDAIGKYTLEKRDIDIKEFLACFSTDVIGSCAFGIECNSFKDPEAEFRQMGIQIFSTSGIRRKLDLMLISKLPELALKLGIKPNTPEVAKFFHEVTEKTVNYREENNVSRPDFLQLLIDLKNSSKDDPNPFTIEQLVAQVFVFFIAGFDTSSTTMNFALYELCRNPDIQEKVRDEINRVLEEHDGEITYESLGEMKYLQQVIDESQRLYPPLATLTRKCVKDYKLRDTDITLEKGTHVIISLYGLQRDADHYPDPERFDPERFSNENKKSRHPFLHLPFGEGPRNCIGLRFGLMQSKIGLIQILRKFRLRISPTTSMPLRINDEVLLLKTHNTLYLQAEKI